MEHHRTEIRRPQLAQKVDLPFTTRPARKVQYVTPVRVAFLDSDSLSPTMDFGCSLASFSRLDYHHGGTQAAARAVFHNN